jgi:hypothetical protein
VFDLSGNVICLPFILSFSIFIWRVDLSLHLEVVSLLLYDSIEVQGVLPKYKSHDNSEEEGKVTHGQRERFNTFLHASIIS